MEPYTLGSIFLDISIALLVISPLIRLILIKRFLKQNKNNELTEIQKIKIKKIFMPVACLALILGIASIVLLII